MMAWKDRSNGICLSNHSSLQTLATYIYLLCLSQHIKGLLIGKGAKNYVFRDLAAGPPLLTIPMFIYVKMESLRRPSKHISFNSTYR